MRDKKLINRIISMIVMVLSGVSIILSATLAVAFLISGTYIEKPETIQAEVVDSFIMKDYYRIYNDLDLYTLHDELREEDIKAQLEKFEDYFNEYYEDSNIIFKMLYENEAYFEFQSDQNSLKSLRNFEETDKITYQIGLIEELPYQDRFQKINQISAQVLNHKFTVYPVFIVSLVLFITSIMVYRKNKNQSRLHLIDKVPLEILLLVCLFLAILLGDSYYYYEPYVFVSLIVVVGILLLSLNRRFEHDVLLKNSITYKIIKKGKYITQNIPVLFKGIILATILTLFEILLFVMFQYTEGLMVLSLVLMNAVLAYLFIKHFTELDIIEKHTAKIKEGELELSLPQDTFLGILNPLSKNLNEVTEATKNAVEKEMKSERMKTELITNVSHDIKTPITSIINYVDLLNETKDESKKDEYLEVLNRQSNRLKHLVEDLIEASKLTTGNIELKKETTDLNVLIEQIVGEVSESFEEKNISLVLDEKLDGMISMADGEMLSRVFDNLLSNALQYSLEGTRVYITLDANYGYNIISIKNISKDALNMDAESLVERFTRADSSRNTEGSGLGLSIAKSIVELHNGKFNLHVDGDLFKVTIYLERGQ